VARVGLALYTVRDECERDLAQTLREVAALGYEGIEPYSLHDHEPAELRALLDDVGLVATSRHAGLAELEHHLPGVAAGLDALGSNRVALSSVDPPATRADAVVAAERVAALAERARAVGLRLGYHNHWFEPAPLEDGGTFLDVLLEQPADLLWFQLDLGWIWEAGADPAEWLERARGRSPIVHVKDFRVRGTASFCPVGDGEVGYERVLPVAVEAGVEWLLVEQDETDRPALAAAERSLAFVRRVLG
jgi:sugar phosphate isomerase/epimerase